MVVFVPRGNDAYFPSSTHLAFSLSITLISSEISKDRPFHRRLILQILNSPDRVTHTHKTINFIGKNPPLICDSPTLCRIIIVLLLMLRRSVHYEAGFVLLTTNRIV